MKLHKDSHLDHGITDAQLGNLLQRFEGRREFFIATIELPIELGDVPLGLFGPAVGDEPVPESEVVYRNRGDREYPSRIIEVAHPRHTRKVTVIAGPHDGEPCVLYTAFGGPLTPQEPGELIAKIDAAQKAGQEASELQAKLKESREFWAKHALIEVVSVTAEQVTEEEILDLFNLGDIDASTFAAARSTDPTPWSAEERRAARARCAELISAQAKGAK